eukprot:6145867-Amphidinium_carterae.2
MMSMLWGPNASMKKRCQTAELFNYLVCQSCPYGGNLCGPGVGRHDIGRFHFGLQKESTPLFEVEPCDTTSRLHGI